VLISYWGALEFLIVTEDSDCYSWFWSEAAEGCLIFWVWCLLRRLVLCFRVWQSGPRCL